MIRVSLLGRWPAIVAGRQGAEAATVAGWRKATSSIPIPYMMGNIWDSKKINNYCYIHNRPVSDENSCTISVSKKKIKQQDLDKSIFNLPYTRQLALKEINVFFLSYLYISNVSLDTFRELVTTRLQVKSCNCEGHFAGDFELICFFKRFFRNRPLQVLYFLYIALLYL